MLRADDGEDRLGRAGAAARARDEEALAGVDWWLTHLEADDLVRVDRQARSGWASRLGPSSGWVGVVDGPAATAGVVVAALHPDGHLREAAVRELVRREGPLATRVLALRTADHVEAVAAPARQEVLRRTGMHELLDVLPVLLRLRGRARATSVEREYLEAGERRYGAAAVWSMARTCNDRRVRREAFRHSAAEGHLSVDEAVRATRYEHDAVVHGVLVRVVADSGSPELVRTLLTSRSSLGRVLALVRLEPEQVGADDVRGLLVDRSELVRLWARRRAGEKGIDAVAACSALARSDAAPTVRERAYRGLVEAGGDVPREEVADLVGSAVSALQRAGLRLLRGHVLAQDVGPLLGVVATAPPRTARLAVEALRDDTVAWSVTDLEPLWTSASTVVRGRAWQLQRGRGGWETTIADLRARAELGAATVPVAVVPTSGVPTEAQRERLRALLPVVDVRAGRVITISAGLPHAAPGRPRGLDRSARDLEQGRPEKARARLFGLLHTRPRDPDVRTLLAQAYRDLGQPAQAGRWGLLQASAATDAECAAFVRHVAGRGRTFIDPGTMRTFQRSPLLRRDLDALADEVGRARVAATAARPPGRWARFRSRLRRSRWEVADLDP